MTYLNVQNKISKQISACIYAYSPEIKMQAPVLQL